jgi:hypothetical protein
MTTRFLMGIRAHVSRRTNMADIGSMSESRSAHGLYLYLHFASVWRLDSSVPYGGYTPTYFSYSFFFLGLSPPTL